MYWNDIETFFYVFFVTPLKNFTCKVPESVYKSKSFRQYTGSLPVKLTPGDEPLYCKILSHGKKKKKKNYTLLMSSLLPSRKRSRSSCHYTPFVCSSQRKPGFERGKEEMVDCLYGGLNILYLGSWFNQLRSFDQETVNGFSTTHLFVRKRGVSSNFGTILLLNPV